MDPEDPDLIDGEVQDELEELEHALDKMIDQREMADFYKYSSFAYQLVVREDEEDMTTELPFWTYEKP